MGNRKVTWAGLAAGVLGHILQGMLAFLIFDHFYLESPELVRDLGQMVAVYYLALNMLTGVVIAYLAHYLKNVWAGPDWLVGIKAGLLLWAGSSPVFAIKRQIMFKLSNWLLFEIITDLLIYALIGAVAGFLSGRGIVDKENHA